MLKIAFIGFGEAARAFTHSLRGAHPMRVAAYDILIHGDGADGLRAAADALDVQICDSAVEAVQDAALIFSAVTAAQSLIALQPLAGALRAGQTVIDINSVSPARKLASARLIRAQGAGYLDMAVMAPVYPAGHRTPVLVAGDLDLMRSWLARLDFRFDEAGTNPGDATAVKMVRSLFVKGLEAITVQTLAAAAASGCHDRILASLAKSFPGLGWPDFAAYEFERVITHGRRRAEELREVAATMDDLGLAEAAALATSIADAQDRVAGAPLGATPAETAAAVARAIATPAAADKAFGT
ncbi:MAG TPA: DUF1932 domain-containing protein [Paracoccaceae bacterium]|nr:DUF1932 domain-containing protein [Paracoccaceae bacterium]